MEIRLLGGVGIHSDQGEHKLDTKTQGRMLAALALHPGKPVSVEKLTDWIWSPDAPERRQAANPVSTIQSYAKRIRRAIELAGGERRWLTGGQRAGFLVLDIDPMLVDYHRFRDLAEAARKARDLDGFDAAFAVWQGIPLAGLSGDWADRRREDMDAQHRTVKEHHLQALLDAGHAYRVLEELHALVELHPTDEFLLLGARALSMLGRQAALPTWIDRLTILMRQIHGAEPSQETLAHARRTTATAQRPPQLALAASSAPGSQLRALPELAGQEVINAVALAGPAAVSVENAVRDHQQVTDRVLSEGFTGRGWVLAEIDNRLAEMPGGYVWIAGDAGVGKTALAAYLVRERGWVGHFAGVSRGATVRVGLQNLVGQLVRRWALADIAPGAMVPEWAFTPEGFDVVLHAAAKRAQDAGCPLVLVVDGADEAETDGQPWGLPSMLPDGVFVVGTYRTGHPPPRAGGHAVVVRLAADDPRNRLDVEAHLRAVLPPGLADEDVVAALSDRCQGVWVYLRYAVEDLRDGVRGVRDLATLPSGLSRYYTDTVDRWSRSPDWDTGLLRLLGVLAVIGEPLDATDLALAADADENAVRRWCHTTLRPFLGVELAGLAARRFAVYHASLREFLNGRPLDDLGSEEDWRWNETLAAAASTARHRIIDHHLDRFGGLEAGLPRLAANPDLLTARSGYAVRHLAGHLLDAGRAEDLCRLLAAGGRTGNTWFAAHEHADAVDDYLADVSALRTHLERRTDEALAEGRPAPTLVDEARCALAVSSTTSLTANIPADLVVALVEAGMWTPSRAVAHARRLHAPPARALLLAALVPLLPDDLRPPAVAWALAAARDPVTHITGDVLTRLAPHLTDVADAVLIASRVRHDGWRAAAQAAIARRLDGQARRHLLREALDSAMSVAGEQDRAEAVRRILPELPHDLVDDAVTAALKATPARATPRPEISALLRHATAGVGEPARVDELVALVPSMSDSAVAEVLSAADGVADLDARAVLLTAIAVRLPVGERPRVLAAALTAARTITADPNPAIGGAASTADHRTRAGVLAGYALPDERTTAVGHGPPLAAARALPEILAMNDPFRKARALATAAPGLTAAEVEVALSAAQLLPEEARARALTGLVPVLGSAAHLARVAASAPSRDRALLVAVVARAVAVLRGPDLVALLRRTMWSVSRTTCLALLDRAAPRLAELAGPGFRDGLAAAIDDARRWWP
ncbi:BTAD domain-containing putative transcriptional regulator [Actinokineospora sp. UTMC 2448]|uniref:BTAD domain-containing putative transcriptional regulator n=1 Tax=Actinokineospora sp. UTMC 2448 TaxID=2268449 RepID=UPI002164C33E|nr:BTAD domain-containing putative transcriptional regulator [Actinokineospora sp. UTMC 2448]UVS80571.1 Regulatory protein AfsR [Actinokineospora sp. UTMC 2448]